MFGRITTAAALVALLQITSAAGYCVRTQYDFDQQADYKRVKGANNDACQKECTSDPACTTVTYVNNNGYCYLKAVTGQVSAVVNKVERTLNVKGDCKEGEEFTVPDNFDIAKFDAAAEAGVLPEEEVAPEIPVLQPGAVPGDGVAYREPCSAELTCKLGLACTVDGICEIAVVLVPIGGACTADSVCAESGVCSDDKCSVPTKGAIGVECDGFLKICMDGAICDASVCSEAATPGAMGAQCSTNVPCSEGLSCEKNVCAAAAVPLEGACSAEAVCEKDLMCSAESVCVAQTVAQLGEACATGSIMCAAGAMCSADVCVAKPEGMQVTEACDAAVAPCAENLVCTDAVCKVKFTCEAAACPAAMKCMGTECVPDPERLACGGKCISGSVCMDSRCTIDAGLPGTVVTTLVSCAEAYCVAGYECNDGYCVPDLKAGGCEPTCADGQICDSAGACIDDVGVPASVREAAGVNAEGASCAAATCAAGFVCSPTMTCIADGGAAGCVDGCAPGEACVNAACSADPGLPTIVTTPACTATSCVSGSKCINQICNVDTNVMSCTATSCLAGSYCPVGAVTCQKDVGVPTLVFNDAEIIQETQDAENAEVQTAAAGTSVGAPAEPAATGEVAEQDRSGAMSMMSVAQMLAAPVLLMWALL